MLLMFRRAGRTHWENNDGKNAGYVLFYLPTFGNALPQYSYVFWGDPTQYGSPTSRRSTPSPMADRWR